MSDCLEIFKKFKDIKEISDCIDEIQTLRYYYNTQQYTKMKQHIHKLTQKYFVETMIWNTINNQRAINYHQEFINADNFMQAQGSRLIVEKVKDYKSYLSLEETSLVETMLNLIRNV